MNQYLPWFYRGKRWRFFTDSAVHFCTDFSTDSAVTQCQVIDSAIDFSIDSVIDFSTDSALDFK